MTPFDTRAVPRTDGKADICGGCLRLGGESSFSALQGWWWRGLVRTQGHNAIQRAGGSIQKPRFASETSNVKMTPC